MVSESNFVGICTSGFKTFCHELVPNRKVDFARLYAKSSLGQIVRSVKALEMQAIIPRWPQSSMSSRQVSSVIARPPERIRQPTFLMENQIDIQTKSSPVTLEVPRDGTAYAEWRQTGKLPEATPAKPKGESAPPKESSAEGKEPK